MSKNDLAELGDDLYVEQLLDHYCNPRNAGTIAKADIDHDGDNPTCGDMIHAYAKLRGDTIEELKFTGKGCAISQASADLLYGDLKGKSLAAVAKLDVKHVEELLGITLRPARVKCADLALVVLKEGIKERQERAG